MYWNNRCSHCFCSTIISDRYIRPQNDNAFEDVDIHNQFESKFKSDNETAFQCPFMDWNDLLCSNNFSIYVLKSYVIFKASCLMSLSISTILVPFQNHFEINQSFTDEKLSIECRNESLSGEELSPFTICLEFWLFLRGNQEAKKSVVLGIFSILWVDLFFSAWKGEESPPTGSATLNSAYTRT